MVNIPSVATKVYVYVLNEGIKCYHKVLNEENIISTKREYNVSKNKITITYQYRPPIYSIEYCDNSKLGVPIIFISRWGDNGESTTIWSVCKSNHIIYKLPEELESYKELIHDLVQQFFEWNNGIR